MFWDSLTHNRTDGALIRLVTTLDEGDDMTEADALLADFLKDLYPELGPYLPA